MATVTLGGGLTVADGSFQIEIGGQHVPGGSPTWGADTYTSLCILKTIRIQNKATKVDVGGACAVKNVFVKPTLILTIGTVLPVSGISAYSADAATILRRWVRITRKNLSSMSTPEIYIGVIEEATLDGADASALMENVTIDCNPA
jgi:hypothetical protein